MIEELTETLDRLEGQVKAACRQGEDLKEEQSKIAIALASLRKNALKRLPAFMGEAIAKRAEEISMRMAIWIADDLPEGCYWADENGTPIDPKESNHNV